MKLGTTFSHVHAASLGLELDESLEHLRGLGLTHIRIGAYWNEIQVESGVWNWESLDHVVRKSTELGFEIILTVGQKAPRWPEFYIPSWATDSLQEHLLTFIERVVTRYDSAVSVWQLENEPLDPSGPSQLAIDREDLFHTLDLMKTITRKPVMMTLWGNAMKSRFAWKMLLRSNVDIIGLDVYFGQPNPNPLMKAVRPFIGPEGRASDWETWGLEIRREKNLWISELQAEPWGDELVVTSERHDSCRPESILENIDRVGAFKSDVVLLWGSEYWLWRAKRGDREWMQVVGKIIVPFRVK